MEKIDIIEGLLYIAGDAGIHEDVLIEHVPITATELKVLAREYNKPHLQIRKYGGKYFLQTTEALEAYHFDIVKRESKSRLSQASLEVLAIVAYNQPVSRADIEHLRGVNSDGPIQTLIARHLIQKKEVKDERYFHFITTDYFLEAFGLESIDNLPKQESHDEEEVQLYFEKLEDDS